MNFTTRFAPTLCRVASTSHQRRPLLCLGSSLLRQQRFLSSTFGQESPLDSFLDPSAPTPLFNSTEFMGGDINNNKDGKYLECGIDESVLRFKTKCYGRLLQAPFVHPNEHKIVMTVPTEALGLLDDLERDILKEIVGRGRWHEDRGELRLQSVSFGSRIENKRHLVSMLDRLVLSCQRLAAEVRQQQAAEDEEESSAAA